MDMYALCNHVLIFIQLSPIACASSYVVENLLFRKVICVRLEVDDVEYVLSVSIFCCVGRNLTNLHSLCDERGSLA